MYPYISKNLSKKIIAYLVRSIWSMKSPPQMPFN